MQLQHVCLHSTLSRYRLLAAECGDRLLRGHADVRSQPADRVTQRQFARAAGRFGPGAQPKRLVIGAGVEERIICDYERMICDPLSGRKSKLGAAFRAI